jgi:long-chain acyl-CoA synthetase
VTLADLLFAPGAGVDGVDAADPVVHAGDVSYSWDDVRSRADGLAGRLVDFGVRPGQAVAVTLPNGVDVVAALFGVWRAGAIYVPLNPRSAAAEVTRVLDSVAPAAVVDAGGIAGLTGGDADPATFGDDVALVQFTSGTTGRPKPVLLTHTGVTTLLDNVVAKLRGGGGPARTPDRDRKPMPNLVPVSLSLWAGIYNVLFALRVGAPVVVMDGFDPVELAALVKRFGIRSTVLPPAAMTSLVDDARVTDLAPLRYVRSITAPLSPLQARRFRDRFGIAVLNSYGQTEIGGEIVGWSAADSRAHGDDKLGSVGRPHAGVELRIVQGEGEGEGEAEGDDGAGELQVRTPALSAGYADGTDLSDRLTGDGWFRTGDIARIDADGFVWIEGRVSDMINRGGLKVYPAEVEEVLRTSPAVADAAVVGVPDERLGEVPVAFVVPAGGGAVDVGAGVGAVSDGLSDYCRAHLAPYKVPARFEVLDALPRNEVGKVLKAQLRGTTGS